MSMRDIQTALVASMQESSLRNLRGGDKDSAGLFQQRPSQGWGTLDQIMDPNYSIRKFYQSLLTVKGRSDIPVWQAAQEVQKSAIPGAYAHWVKDSNDLLSKMSISAMQTGVQSLYSSYTTGSPEVLQEPVGLPDLQGVTDTVPPPAGLEETLPAGLGAPGTEIPDPYSQLDDMDRLLGSEPDGLRGSIIDMAKSFLGTPYKWGATGPSAFDCSGFIYYIFNKLGIKPLVNGQPGKIPRVSYDQALIGQHTDVSSLLPGDFVVFGNDAHHIAIYIGNGQIIEAPNSKETVRIRSLGDNENVWGVHLDLGGY
jgi:cell wall-associated NlpC family hydrolase